MKGFYFIVFVVIVLFAWNAFGQCGPNGCPSGGCPAPGIGQQQGGWMQGRSGSLFRVPAPEVPPPPGEDDESQGYRDPEWDAGQAPEWLVHVRGASGMLVAKGEDYGTVLTAYHVIEGGLRTGIPIRFENGEQFDGAVVESETGDISADKAADIALVFIPQPKAEPCAIADRQPTQGETLSFLGYGGGRFRKHTGPAGPLISKPYKGGMTTPGILYGGGFSISGDSGGAVLNARGELCSVISRSDRQTSTLGSSLKRIHQLCTDERFIFPWQARKQAEIERGSAERERGNAERERARAYQAEQEGLPIPLPPGESVERSTVDALQRQVEGFDERLGKMESWNPLLEELQAAKEKLLAMDPANLKTELGREVQADLKAAADKADKAASDAAAASSLANAAGETAKTVAATVGTVAEEKAKEVVEAEKSGWLATAHDAADGLISNRLDDVGLHNSASAVRWLWAAMCSTWGVIILLTVVIGFIVAMRRIPGAKETVRRAENWVVDQIPGQWDNRGLSILQGLTDTVAGLVTRVESMAGLPPPVYAQHANPQQPKTPTPTSPQSAA